MKQITCNLSTKNIALFFFFFGCLELKIVQRLVHTTFVMSLLYDLVHMWFKLAFVNCDVWPVRYANWAVLCLHKTSKNNQDGIQELLFPLDPLVAKNQPLLLTMQTSISNTTSHMLLSEISNIMEATKSDMSQILFIYITVYI